MELLNWFRVVTCPFDLLLTCPYNNQWRGENQPMSAHAAELIFHTPVLAYNTKWSFLVIVLRVMLLTYTQAMIRFSNCGGLSRMMGQVESKLY